MRVGVVADVHGNVEALARVADSVDRLIILGDLLDYIDYRDPHRGIIGEIFGASAAGQFAALRRAGRFVELRQFNVELWSDVPNAAEVVSQVVQDRYRLVREAIGADSLVTLGNVDVVADWERAVPDVPFLDGQVVDIEGVKFGFVAGGAMTRRRVPQPAGEAGSVAWRPFLKTASDYRQSVDAIGPVDVLCAHVPPDIAVLRYDVVAARLETYGPGLIEHIDRYQPQLALFGHVHQPLMQRTRRGMTECINVGHFQRWGRPLILDLEQLQQNARVAGETRLSASR